MHALKRFGTAFGGYKMMENYPEPECGPDDIILEIKAAAICGADMKHWGVDNGYDDTNCEGQQQSVRGHEFAGEIVKVGENVKDWHVGQRVVSDNSAHVCGVCPACEQGDFLCCEHKVNLGLDNNTWGGGFSKYCKVPGEILAIHKHAIWEIPEGVKYEEAAVLDPICNAYKAVAQQSHLIPGQDFLLVFRFLSELRSQNFASFTTTSCQYATTIFSCHTVTETMFARTTKFTWLISTFHDEYLLIDFVFV